MTRFDSLVGPDGPSSGPPAAADLRQQVERWVLSEPMRLLVTLSGWGWPHGDARSVLGGLESLSAAWDFRSGAERHSLSHRPAVVGDRELDDALIVAAATDLGLAGGMDVYGPFDHLLVLGGMARACLRRVRLAHELVSRMEIHSIAVLTAHRPLQGQELHDAIEDAGRPLAFENEAATSATQQVFHLAENPDRFESDHPRTTHRAQGIDELELERRLGWSVAHWDQPLLADIFVAPSSEPLERRADTVDQLRFWSDRTDLGPDDRILMVTTEHYVPYQHFQGLRVLTLERGCTLVTTGTDWMPAGGYRGTGYLQEVRSALRAARELWDAASPLEG
jgi:hypothetical protein